jgi:hypothetical protein
MADHRTTVRTAGELLEWLSARIADGSLSSRAKLSCPDLYGSGRDVMEVMVTQGGIPAAPEPNLFQCWGATR